MYKTQGLDDLHVGGEPVDIVELAGGKPARRLVFQELRRLSARDGAEEAVHRQVECGVVVFHGAQEIADIHVDREFFLQFAC